MVLEYLFFDKNKRQNVEAYNHELETSDTGNGKNSSVQITYKDFDELECWIVKYERNGNNETTAKQSSEISTYICQEFSPTILTDESSEYFNKSLYPLVNKFERLLRKFLYLKVSQCDEQKFRSVISDIDQKDFGEIYTILFIDNNFRVAARDKIKKLNTRAEMYEAIDALQESTAWHILVGDEVLTIIKDNFDLLKEYRNDVMHAHNISWEKYKKAKKLFTDANDALEMELNQLLQYPSVTPLSEKTASTLYEKMMAFNAGAEKIGTSMASALEGFAKIAETSVPKELSANLEKMLQLLASAALPTSDDQSGKDIQSTADGEVKENE